MSLNYDLSKIKESKTVCWIDNRLDPSTGKGGPGMNPLTESLIFATMAIGLGVITKENYKKFYDRLHKWELLVGNYLGDRGPISLDDVQRHVGLRTNVYPQVSDKAFGRKLLKIALDNAERRSRIEAAKQQEREDKRAKRSQWRDKSKKKVSEAK